MKEQIEQKSFRTQSQDDFNAKERRHNNRRLCEKKGFAYISMVGWMCRREHVRRKDDDVCGW